MKISIKKQQRHTNQRRIKSLKEEKEKLEELIKVLHKIPKGLTYKEIKKRKQRKEKLEQRLTEISKEKEKYSLDNNSQFTIQLLCKAPDTDYHTQKNVDYHIISKKAKGIQLVKHELEQKYSIQQITTLESTGIQCDFATNDQTHFFESLNIEIPIQYAFEVFQLLQTINYFDNIKVRAKSHHLFEIKKLQKIIQQYNVSKEQQRVEHIFPDHQGLVGLLKQRPEFFGISPFEIQRIATEEEYYNHGRLYFQPDITFETPSLTYLVEVKSGSKPFHREKAKAQVARMLEYRESLGDRDKDVRVCLVMPHTIPQLPKRFMPITQVLQELSLEIYPRRNELERERIIEQIEKKYHCA
jgi:hypothetical protein